MACKMNDYRDVTSYQERLTIASRGTFSFQKSGPPLKRCVGSNRFRLISKSKDGPAATAIPSHGPSRLAGRETVGNTLRPWMSPRDSINACDRPESSQCDLPRVVPTPESRLGTHPDQYLQSCPECPELSRPKNSHPGN